MGGKVVRGPWRKNPRYVVVRLKEARHSPAVPAGAWVYADPVEPPTVGSLVLAERAGLRVLTRFPVDPLTVRVVGAVVAAVFDPPAS